MANLPLYYVYKHVDPVDPDFAVYIGCGHFARAWECGSRRTADHAVWMEEMARKFPPTCYVRIIEANLFRIKALAVERSMLYEYVSTYGRLPIFNIYGAGFSGRRRGINRKYCAKSLSERKLDEGAHAAAFNTEMRKVEASAVKRALATCRTLTLAAKTLGIGRTTLYRKMQEYQINQFDVLERHSS